MTRLTIAYACWTSMPWRLMATNGFEGRFVPDTVQVLEASRQARKLRIHEDDLSHYEPFKPAEATYDLEEELIVRTAAAVSFGKLESADIPTWHVRYARDEERHRLRR